MKIIDDENKNVETPNMNIFDHSSTVTMPRVLLQSSSLLNDDLFIFWWGKRGRPRNKVQYERGGGHPYGYLRLEKRKLISGAFLMTPILYAKHYDNNFVNKNIFFPKFFF